MEAPPRGALLLVYFVASCLLVVGLLDVGLYLAQCLQPKHQVPVRILPLVLDGLPFIAGAVMLAKAKALAAWIAEKLDL